MDPFTRRRAAVLAVTVAVLGSGASYVIAHADDRPAMTAVAVVAHRAVTLVDPSAPTRLVSRNGVTLRVPTSLKDGTRSCGAALTDLVAYNIGPDFACAYNGPRPPVTDVEFAGPSSPTDCHPEGDASLARCIDAKPDYLGRTAAVVVSQTNRVSVAIASLDRALVSRIVDSARAVDEVDGCQVHPTHLGATPPSRSGAKDQLVPGVPVSVTVCRWYDGILIKSAVLPPKELATFAPRMNKARTGLGHAGAKSGAPQPGDARCATEDSQYVRAHVTYASGPPLDVWFRPTGCGRVIGFDNGARTGFLTYPAWDAMTYVVGVENGIPGALS